MKLPRRKLMALLAWLSWSGGKELYDRKMPQDPSLGCFNDDRKV
jgi:hypothetical protein